MTDTSQMPAPTVTGRTPWDFATEGLVTLQRLGPAAIIVSGFLLFGYLFYIEVKQVRLEVDKQLQAKLDGAQAQLVTTYEKIGGMSEQLIENIEKLLKLNSTIDDDVEASRKRLKETEQAFLESRQKLEKEKEAAESEVRKLKVTIGEHVATRQKAEGVLAQLQTQRKKLAIEIAKVKEERENQNKMLVARAAQIAGLRAQIEPPTASTQGSSVLQRAREVLVAFVTDPQSVSAEDFNNLIGIKVDSLKNLIEQGLGYTAWFDWGGIYLVGIARPNNEELGSYLRISTDSERVSRVDTRETLIFTRLKRLRNWYEESLVGLLVTEGRVSATYADADLEEISLTEWSRLLRYDSPAVPLFGSVEPLRVVPLDELGDHNPALDVWKSDSDLLGRPALNFRMMKRAKGFKASALPGMATANFPPKLRKITEAVLESALVKDRTAIESNLGPGVSTKVLGSVAALILQDGVNIVEVRQSTEKDDGGASKSADVIVEFDRYPRSTSEPALRAVLRFTATADSWRLDELLGFRKI